MNHPSDEELIAGCAGGDRRSMDVLVSRYHAKLLDFAFRHLHERDAAADIAQATLIRVYQSATGYRAQASFRTWVYTIALNLIRDECRRRGVRRETVFSTLVDSDQLEDESEDPEEAAVEGVLRESLWAAVGSLQEDRRTAILLKFRYGLTYPEIAQVMYAPEGTVKSWIHHGLRTLRERLSPVSCGE